MIYKIRYYYIFLLMISAVFTSCNSKKTVLKQTAIFSLDSIVKTKDFTINSHSAEPQMSIAMQNVLNSGLMAPGNNAGNISMIGNDNYLTIKGDSIKSYLPYYGERQMSGGYGGDDSAITFKGVMKDYNVRKHKKGFYTISFSAKSKSENFEVAIQVFSNLKTYMMVNGDTRSMISYTGMVSQSISDMEK